MRWRIGPWRISICLFGAQQRKHPLQLPLGGLAELTWILPKKADGKITPLESRVGVQGKCSVEYPPVPASSYILTSTGILPDLNIAC